MTYRRIFITLVTCATLALVATWVLSVRNFTIARGPVAGRDTVVSLQKGIVQVQQGGPRQISADYSITTRPITAGGIRTLRGASLAKPYFYTEVPYGADGKMSFHVLELALWLPYGAALIFAYVCLVHLERRAALSPEKLLAEKHEASQTGEDRN